VVTEDGMLYEGHALVVPDTLILPVIQMHHDKVFAGHPGIKCTRDLLRLHFSWPTLNRDVEHYVTQCGSCAEFKSGRSTTAPLGELPETFTDRKSVV
jgi:hypothetical protein